MIQKKEISCDKYYRMARILVRGVHGITPSLKECKNNSNAHTDKNQSVDLPLFTALNSLMIISMLRHLLSW